METKDWITLCIAAWGAVLGTTNSIVATTRWWGGRTKLSAEARFYRGERGRGFTVNLESHSTEAIVISSWRITVMAPHLMLPHVYESGRDAPPIRIAGYGLYTITMDDGGELQLIAAKGERMEISLRIEGRKPVTLTAWSDPTRWERIKGSFLRLVPKRNRRWRRY